jgi:hypothetical protein
VEIFKEAAILERRSDLPGVRIIAPSSLAPSSSTQLCGLYPGSGPRQQGSLGISARKQPRGN